eukprot:1964721-Amphidinium_carterae.1
MEGVETSRTDSWRQLSRGGESAAAWVWVQISTTKRFMHTTNGGSLPKENSERVMLPYSKIGKKKST